MDSHDDEPTPADDAQGADASRAQQDGDPRTDEEPLHGCMAADSEANQATVFTPAAPARTSRKRRRSLIAAAVCAALVIVVAVAVHVMGKQRERRLLDMEPQSGPAPLAEPVGYSGEARATGAPSPAWARGVATAWRIDEELDETFPEYGARPAVEGPGWRRPGVFQTTSTGGDGGLRLPYWHERFPRSLPRRPGARRARLRLR